MKNYSAKFYEKKKEGSYYSAKEIVPIIIDLIQPQRVIDIGCGIGTWLSAFQEYGVDDILGIDGEWVQENMLVIPKNKFIAFDLTKPFRIQKEFDLVVSLEVAEHLPKEKANVFIESLASLGPVILFSAAIPFQGGENHLNEQWPEYWARFFIDRGYVIFDILRQQIWDNNKIDFWYAQNILLLVKKEALKKYPKLKMFHPQTGLLKLSIVHPKLYMKSLQEKEAIALAYEKLTRVYKDSQDPMKMLLNLIPTLMKNVLKKKLRSG